MIDTLFIYPYHKTIIHNMTGITMNYEILIGDCIESMKCLPENLFNTCVTSPPYYGLRDYGIDGQIGLEETPEEFIEKLVLVFREVKRLLRDDGTLWVNIGDSYAANRTYQVASTKGGKKHSESQKVNGKGMRVPDGMKPKDMIGIPWLLAFALRNDGWYLRQDIIWEKPNVMPESVKDRFVKSHEYMFMFSKNKQYYFDHDSIREKTDSGSFRTKRDVWRVPTTQYKGPHCAVFPPELIEPCILAGCPEYGIVLDPFGGSGTTAGVAVKHNRFAYLCELNPDYVKIVEQRVNQIITG